jgi:GWxTD domain-containing protein
MKRTFLLLGLAALTCSFAVAQKQTRKPSSNPSVQSDLIPAYQRWLNEDVVSIITPEERGAFLLLKSDAERERFIAQFWQARDSNPGNSDNEYRTEHYRRIAHANQNFGIGTVPGWQTARGRIYITMGEPDDVRQTSSGEVWLYRRAPGSGSNVEIEFIRDSSTGDLRIKPNP